MIRVLYSCYDCKVRDQPVKVRYRRSGEPLVDWIQSITIIIYRDHLLNSLLCERALDLSIPTPIDGEEIGCDPAGGS